MLNTRMEHLPDGSVRIKVGLHAVTMRNDREAQAFAQGVRLAHAQLSAALAAFMRNRDGQIEAITASSVNAPLTERGMIDPK